MLYNTNIYIINNNNNHNTIITQVESFNNVNNIKSNTYSYSYSIVYYSIV